MEPMTNDAMAPKRLKTGGKKPLIILGITVGTLAVLLAGGYAGLCAYAGSLDTFYPNYTINGVDVAGLTAQQAQAKLEEETPQREIPLYDSNALTSPGETPQDPLLTVTLEELGFSPEAVTSGGCAVPFDQWAQSCMEEQAGRSFLDRGRIYLQSLAGNYTGTWFGYTLSGTTFDDAVETIGEQLSQDALDASYEFGVQSISITKARDGRSVDMAGLRRGLQSAGSRPCDEEESLGIDVSFSTLPAKTLTAQEISDETADEVKNAGYDAATDSITPEQVGAEFDVDAAQKALDAAEPGETVTVPAQIEYPTVTAEELKDVLFRDVLGQCRTHVSGTSARINNVKLSAAACNGVVLNPGDVFSYNETTGQRTTAKGYQAAPAYVQGQTVDEIGGGVCQTSSTLYYACLRSNLEITERYAHRYVPAYIDWGMDATVSWGGPDYKFTNNTNYPIKIQATYSGGYLTIKILGTNVDGSYVKMTNEVLSSTPWTTVYEDDDTLPAGTEKVVTSPYTGYKVKSYRNLYAADGTLISSTYEATSDYKVRNKVIAKGPALPQKEEVPTGGDTQLPAGGSGTTQTPDQTTPPADTGSQTTPTPEQTPSDGSSGSETTIPQTPEQPVEETPPPLISLGENPLGA